MGGVARALADPGRTAADAPGDAIRMWDRLGYPRRALRLHAAAVAVVERHGGEVPADHDALLALPGIGGYTAAAVASFAFGGGTPSWTRTCGASWPGS